VTHRYTVMEMLGQGTFGQVAACYSESHGCSVAVKVIKNQPAYYHQARVEVKGGWGAVGRVGVSRVCSRLRSH